VPRRRTRRGHPAPIANARRRLVVDCPARLGEREHVGRPGALVEVGRHEPAGLVREEGVDAHDVAPLEVIPDDLIRHGKERLIGALPALDTRLLADAAHPLVRAGGGVPLPAGRGVRPELRVEVVPAPEELTEQGHLLGRRLGPGRLGDHRKQPVRCAGPECGELTPESIEPALCQSALVLEARDPRLLPSDRLLELVRRRRCHGGMFRMRSEQA
jgi:hypothetical protein